jgi:beta-phosphoglucomutase family hydrolase
LKRPAFAVLFDMDGVLVDNNPFHKKAYLEFCRRHGVSLTDAEFEKHLFGRTNRDVLRRLFGPLSAARTRAYEREKERLYRRLYAPHIRPLKGVRRFLRALRTAGVPVALATSAPPENVRYTLSGTGLGRAFDAILDSRAVKKGKPDPEIYLKSARRLGVPPRRCVVIEDSLSGIRAARRARMPVVAVTTTHSRRELSRRADLVVDDFSELDPAGMLRLF